MNRLVQVSLAPAAASANNISTSQTPGGAGNLTITGSAATGGVATLDIARRVLITTAADESGKTLTITGTDRRGRPQTETITGPNATTATSLKDFLTITQIAVSAAFTGAVTVGTTGKVSSQWIPVDRVSAENLGFGIEVTGTINYTVEHTFSDPFSSGVGVQPATDQGAPYLTPYAHPTIAAKTDNDNGFYVAQPITAVRVTINSFSTGATLVGNFAPGSLLGAI